MLFLYLFIYLQEAEGDNVTMKNTKVRALTDTSVAAALCVLLVIIIIYIPFLSTPMALASGIPLMYICFKHNWRYGVLAGVCATLVAFVLTGNIITLALIMLTYVIPGLIFGICSSKGLKFMNSVFVSALSAVLGFVLELVLLNGGGNGIDDALAQMAETMNQSMNAAFSHAGVPLKGDIKLMIDTSVKQAVNQIRLYIPSMIIILAVIYAYIVAGVGVFVLNRIRVKTPEYTKFYMIKAPKSMCVITIILFVICNVSQSTSLIMSAMQNLLFISAGIMGVCGLSAVDFKLHKKIKSGYIRAIVYVAVFFGAFMFASVLFMFLIMLGLTDGIFERRSIKKIGEDKNEDS